MGAEIELRRSEFAARQVDLKHFELWEGEMKLHTFSFSPAVTEDGFWLYIWRVSVANKELLYVGRTGDNSSPNASSAFTRMSQHLGMAKSQNALRRHLRKAGHSLSDCSSFNFICFGPIFPRVNTAGLSREEAMQRHVPLRNIVGALEMRLAHRLAQAGYTVVNSVSWKHECNDELWKKVESEVATEFPNLVAASLINP